MAASLLAPVLRPLRKWADFVKISHTVFALPFALAAMAVAARDTRGWPGWRTFLLILAAMICARTAAMVFNRLVDREFDAANPRTALRHLPTGRISVAAAWGVFLACALGLILASYYLNRICFYLSPIALFFVCFYSLTKRFTDFTHVFLGIALALAPIGAWLAVTGSFEIFPMRDGIVSVKHSALLAVLLAVAVVFWLIGFDIIYAIQDYEFDRRAGLHSIVVRWGIVNALRASFLAHLIMWVTLGVFGLLARFWVAYLMGLAIILACLVFEHWLARKRKLKWINRAFFRMNAMISLVFLIVTTAEVVFPRFQIGLR